MKLIQFLQDILHFSVNTFTGLHLSVSEICRIKSKEKNIDALSLFVILTSFYSIDVFLPWLNSDSAAILNVFSEKNILTTNLKLEYARLRNRRKKINALINFEVLIRMPILNRKAVLRMPSGCKQPRTAKSAAFPELVKVTRGSCLKGMIRIGIAQF